MSSFWRNALNIWRKRSHHDTEKLSELLQRYMRTGDRADLERAIEATKQAAGQLEPGSPLLPKYLCHLGDLLRMRYDRTDNPADAERAISVLEQALEQTPPDSFLRLGSLSYLGEVLRMRYTREALPADAERAISVLEQALEQTPPNSPFRPGSLANLGAVLTARYSRTFNLTDAERAIGAFEQALEQAPPNSPQRLEILRGLASCLIVRFDQTGDPGDMERTIGILEQALEQTPPDSPLRPDILQRLGRVFRQRFNQTYNLADIDRSIDLSEQAVELTDGSEQTAMHNYYDTEQILIELSSGLIQRFNRTGDLSDAERAIGILEQALEQTSPDSPLRPNILTFLNTVLFKRYLRTSDSTGLDWTVDAFEQALERTQVGPEDEIGLGEMLFQRFMRTGDQADLDRAIEVHEQVSRQLAPGSPLLPEAMALLGGMLFQRFSMTAERSDLERAITSLETWWSARETAFSASPVTYKLGQQTKWTTMFTPVLLVSAYIKQAQVNQSKAPAARRRALEIVEGSKSRLLGEQIGRADLPAPSTILPEEVDREHQLLVELTVLDNKDLTTYGLPLNLPVETNPHMRLQQRQRRLQELEELWAQMAQAGHEAAEYVSLRRGMPATWEDLARLAKELGAETALISFFTTDDRALLFILRAGWEEPAIVENGFSESARTYTMGRLFREVHTSGGSTRRGETWHEPLKVLLEKAKVHLKGVTRVVFAPYSIGHLIPWSVVAERAGWRDPDQQLLPLVTLPALGLLSRLRNRPSRRDGPALVAGNPLGDLKYAEEEAREVAAILGAEPLLGPQATKAKVQTSLPKATVAHLATHAYFESNSPLDSGILLADYEVFTAREVMDQRLSADLLILSACETAMAQSLGGDELAGLGQAFLQAGARSIIVSLWRVNDSATAALMKAFYEARRAEEIDNAQALNQAITHIQEQEKWHHPYYWGAFVFMGDW